jgi:3-mercaptopyruvate sulfurtransferase SseA
MNHRQLSSQLLTILASGAALGLGLNALSPHPTALGVPVYPAAGPASGTCSVSAATQPRRARAMPLREALAACASCSAAFVDARGTAAFEQGHIAGAIHLPRGDTDELRQAIDRLRSFETIVVYDDAVGCELAQPVVDLLVEAGFPDVRLLEGTWTDWQAAQGPAQAGACEACDAGGRQG